MKGLALMAAILAASSSSAFGDAGNGASSVPGYYVGDGDIADFALEVGDGGAALLYLTHKPSNEPYAGATVTLQPTASGKPAVKFESAEAAGVYKARIEDPASLPGQVLIQTAADSDAIETTVPKYKVAAAPAAAGVPGVAPANEASNTKALGMAAGAGALATAVIGLLLWLLLGRKRAVAKAAIPLLMLTAGAAVFSERAAAHGGHDHGGPALESGGDAGGDVIMSKKSQLLIELRTAKVKKESVPGVLKTFGHVIPKPQLDAALTAPQAGFIHGIQGLALGARVTRGQRLGTLQAVGAIPIESPIDGEISEINAVDGSRVDAGGKLLRVTNMATLWVDAELFADQLQRLKEATGASIMIDGLSTPVRAKMLNAMSPVSEETRTAKVFLELLAPPKDLRIGTLATVSFALAARGESIQIPASALLNRAGDRIVFVQTGPETFAPRQVVISDSAEPATVLVTQGLKDGDRVVTSGNYQLLMKAK